MSTETAGELPTGPGLYEAFADAASKVFVTCQFFDMVNSTGMKVTMPESGWLPQVGFLYDTIAKRVARYDDVAIKFLGDGVVVFYQGDDYGPDAIQVAIDVQETIQDASRVVDGAKGKIDFHITVGITTGAATRFVTPTGTIDYVGMNIDKAGRLCGAASAQAIFVDRSTITATNFNRVHSKFGAVVHRDADGYQGNRQSVSLKGIPNPVEYYEILWDSQLFGVKSELLTETAGRPSSSTPLLRAAAVKSTAPGPAARGRAEKFVGSVKQWNPDKHFGFVTSTTGEDFYFNPDHDMVYPEDADDLRPGVGVAFLALPPSGAGRSRRAGAMLVAGRDADGILVVPPGDRPHGWIEVRTESGVGQLVFAARQELADSMVKGSSVSFRLEVGPRGAFATAIEPSDVESAA